MQRRASAAHLTLMGSLVVVIGQPGIQIGLQFFRREVEPSAEGDLIELLQDGFVEAFADSVGLRMAGLGLGVLDVVDG